MKLGRVDRCVLDSLLPAGAHPLLQVGIADTGFEQFLDEFRAAAPPHLWRAFRTGLYAGGWVAPALIRRRPPITRLSAIDRERALAAMESSRVPELRQLLMVLKSVASLHYGALTEVRRAIGYP